MKKYNLFLLTLSLLIFFSMASLSVKAEVSEESTRQDDSEVESLLTESSSLLVDINELQRQSALLKEKFPEVPEFNRPLFINLVLAVEDKLRAKLDKLIAVQQELPEKVDTGALRGEIQTICAEQSKVIQDEIKLLQKIISQLQEKHAAQDSRQDSLQSEIERVDLEINHLIAAWLKNIEREKSLHMEVAKDVALLTNTIQIRAIVQTSRIQIILDNITLLNDRLEDATPEEQQVLTRQLRQLEIRKKIAATNLEEMVSIMNSLGVETTAFGKVLVVATGKILNENVNTKAVFGIFQMMTSKAMHWLTENLPMLVFRIISFTLIILLFKLLANIVRRLVNRAVNRSQLESSQLLQEFLGSITSKLVMLIGLIIALSQLGIEIGPLLAGMGVMGFVVGFALQDALSNFASGLMILIYRPFDIGDFVEVAGINGTVKQMNLVSATILTVDRKRMIIPNSKIWGDIITNVTAENLRRIDFVFGIGYGDNIAEAEQVMLNIVKGHPLILAEPKPIIKVHALNESSVDFVVRPWVKTENYWEVYWDITRQVKEKFDAEGISIPFPQRDIHVFSAPDIDTVNDAIPVSAGNK